MQWDDLYSSSVAKPTTCSKDAGRNEKRAADYDDHSCRQILLGKSWFEKSVDSSENTKACCDIVTKGNKAKYGNFMKEARPIKLKYLGITDLRCQRVVTSGIVLEMPGNVRGSRAEILAFEYDFEGRDEICVILTAEIRW